LVIAEGFVIEKAPGRVLPEKGGHLAMGGTGNGLAAGAFFEFGKVRFVGIVSDAIVGFAFAPGVVLVATAHGVIVNSEVEFLDGDAFFMELALDRSFEFVFNGRG
jgi:hypothetical protein